MRPGLWPMVEWVSAGASSLHGPYRGHWNPSPVAEAEDEEPVAAAAAATTAEERRERRRSDRRVSSKRRHIERKEIGRGWEGGSVDGRWMMRSDSVDERWMMEDNVIGPSH